MKYYVLNKNRRWERVNKCGSDTFTFKRCLNIIENFENFEVKVK